MIFVIVLMAGCASQSMGSGQPASGGGATRYLCYTYVGGKHVMTLPVPADDAETPLIPITFHGDTIWTIYQRNGLTQIWSFEEGLYIQIDPDLVGRYMDFRGAEEGERRQADSVFECKKRG